MPTYTKPLTIRWGIPFTALWLAVTSDAAGSNVLRERTAVGTTDARGDLSIEVAGWDTAWRGFLRIDDGSNTLTLAFEPGVESLNTDSAGTGARVVTVTVNDGSNAIEGARVRLTSGATTHVQSTNASGQAIFAVNDATWMVAIALEGYTFTPTTLEVDGDKTPTYSLTPVVVTPPSAEGKTVGLAIAYDSEGNPAAGITVYAQLHQPPGAGIYNCNRFETISGANGMTAIEMIKGGEYNVWVDGGPKVAVKAPTDADTFQISKPILGAKSP